MAWWQSRTEKLLREVIASQRDEVLSLRKLNDENRERIDRLTEALARKAGVDLILPQPPSPPLEPAQTSSLFMALRDPAPVTVSPEFFKGAKA